MIMEFSPNLDQLNGKLDNVVGRFEGRMRLIGGGGFASLSRNWRLGGLGAAGSKTIEEQGREAELSVSYGGMLAEYAIPLGRIQFSIGGLIGWGHTGLRVSRRNWNMDWDDFWHNYEEDSLSSNDYSGHLSASFFCYEPYVAVQFAISESLHLRGSVGYIGADIDGSAWHESGIELRNAPSLDLSSYRAQFFLLLGWFAD